MYGIHCEGDNCDEFYIGETEQLLHRRMSQHRRHSTGGQESTVYERLHTSDHTFNTENVQIIDRENSWFERGVKEAIWVSAKNPSLNRHGGIRFNK